MVIRFPGFYIELYIICTVQMAICIELYTYNPDIHSYAHIIICVIRINIIINYGIRKLCDIIIQKTKVCHGQTFI